MACVVVCFPQVMRQLGGIEAGLQTPELAVARLEKLHLNRHNIL